MNRIALVEDNLRLSQLLTTRLAAAGIEVDGFTSAGAAWDALSTREYAVLIVDRGLPDGDGLQLLKRLRAARNGIPCLFLTARDALHDRVAGLDAGADDYLTKPFAFEELVARVRVLMRRPAEIRMLVPEFSGIRVLATEASMSSGTHKVPLASAELQIMLVLVARAGQTLRRAALEHAAWGAEGSVTPNALDVALHRLRRKLAAIGSDVRIANVRGLGYALRTASDPEGSP